jgi:hypothetical protein
MTRKPAKPRVYVQLRAYWGNGDADSTIKVSHRRWEAIRAGAEYWTSTWSWYEGKRYSVSWSFADGDVSISGEDGRQCLVDTPVDELFADIMASG